MLKTCNKNKLNRADRPLRSPEKYFLSINKLFNPSRWLKEKKDHYFIALVLYLYELESLNLGKRG